MADVTSPDCCDSIIDYYNFNKKFPNAPLVLCGNKVESKQVIYTKKIERIY
jgi:hypothetical protein